MDDETRIQIEALDDRIRKIDSAIRVLGTLAKQHADALKILQQPLKGPARENLDV